MMTRGTPIFRQPPIMNILNIHEHSLPHGAIVPEEVEVCIRDEAVFVCIPKPRLSKAADHREILLENDMTRHVIFGSRFLGKVHVHGLMLRRPVSAGITNTDSSRFKEVQQNRPKAPQDTAQNKPNIPQIEPK